MISLETLGWSSFFEQNFASMGEMGFEPGRVAVERKNSYLIYTGAGEYTAEASGKLLFSADSPADLPKVGDWVAATVFKSEGKAIIHHVLPRKSSFSRKMAGNRTDEQIIATNIDSLFIMQGLDNDYNPRRLERYLVMAYESRANPVIVLNKSDLCDNVAQKAAEVETIAAGAPVLALSAKTSQGLAPLLDFIKPGQTVAFIGSSGVGKSTLINTLLGSEVQKTREVRLDDARGRHTTTHRELILMPQGGLLIDTPGMREMQLWGAGDGMADTFTDIDRLAARCHFRDCTHTREAKCAVLAALDSGELDASRYQSYLKLQKELAHLAENTLDKGSYFARKQRQKEIYRYRRQITKHKLSR